MAAKPKSKKKAVSGRRSVDAGDKDNLIIEQKNRITVLENELRLKQEDAIYPDSAAHKQAEEALCISEAKFRALFENAGAAIYIIDVETGAIVDCNSNAERLVGRTRDELMEMVVTQMHPPDDVEKHRSNFMDRARQGQVINIEGEALHRDGRRIPVIINAAPIVIGGRKVMMGVFLDITERKRAEEALSSSQQMLQMVMDNIPQAVFWKDRNSVIIGCNKVLATAAGLEKPEDIRGKTDYDLPWSREQADFFRECDRRIMENDRPEYHIIEQQREFDGRNAWVETNKVPLHDANGTVIGILGTYEDITERKRAEELLRESEAKFRALFEGAGVAIFVADVATGKIVDCNGKAEELIGRPREEIIGLHQTQLHPEDRAKVQREQFACHANGVNAKSDEALVLHRDGRVIPVIINATPLKINRREIIIGFFLDITDRKQAEEALSKNLAVLARSQEIAHLGSWSLDFDTGKFEASDEEYRIHGFEPQSEVLLDHVWPLIHSDDLKRYREYVESVQQEGRLGGIDYRILWRDGSLHYVHVTTDSVVRGPDGRVKTASGITLDITERKQAEEALKESKAQAELYLDLMGHDINNMHQIALGYLELARDIRPEASQNEFLDKPIEVLQRSARLIQNVSKLQKLKEGVFQTQVVDVCPLLVDVQRELGSVPHKAVTLNLNGCEQCHVRANELLHDVFANLVSNAIKHTGDRADIIVDLDVVWNDGRQYCRVVVEDDGPGIPDDSKGRIFNRMLKGTDKAKGMGLGLFLVKSLVESYGGRVWVEDRVQGDHAKGASFVIMLPAIETESH